MSSAHHAPDIYPATAGDSRPGSVCVSRSAARNRVELIPVGTRTTMRSLTSSVTSRLPRVGRFLMLLCALTTRQGNELLFAPQHQPLGNVERAQQGLPEKVVGASVSRLVSLRQASAADTPAARTRTLASRTSRSDSPVSVSLARFCGRLNVASGTTWVSSLLCLAALNSLSCQRERASDGSTSTRTASRNGAEQDTTTRDSDRP